MDAARPEDSRRGNNVSLHLQVLIHC
jgi:hypothetical protein